MIIGIPVYDGVDLLDVTGPYEMFKWMKRRGCRWNCTHCRDAPQCDLARRSHVSPP